MGVSMYKWETVCTLVWNYLPTSPLFVRPFHINQYHCAAISSTLPTMLMAPLVSNRHFGWCGLILDPHNWKDLTGILRTSHDWNQTWIVLSGPVPTNKSMVGTLSVNIITPATHWELSLNWPTLSCIQSWSNSGNWSLLASKRMTSLSSTNLTHQFNLWMVATRWTYHGKTIVHSFPTTMLLRLKRLQGLWCCLRSLTF